MGMPQAFQEVILVDENDRVLGRMEKLEAHRMGRLHRAFSVMLYRRNPLSSTFEVLLQQRAFNKYHTGGLWANTCCSHPEAEEEILKAAYRRLREEIFGSMENATKRIHLKKIAEFTYRVDLDNGLIEHEFDHVFIGEYPEEVSSFNREEIAQMAWVSLDELIKKMAIKPSSTSRIYVPWLKEICLRTREYLDENV